MSTDEMDHDHVAKVMAGRPKAEKPVKVTRHEELLYEGYAPYVRLLGDIAVAAEKARDEMATIVNEARDSDQLVAGLVTKPRDWDPPTGTTEHTRWVDVMERDVWDLAKLCYDMHRSVAHDVAGRVMAARSHIDSQPSPEPYPG